MCFVNKRENYGQTNGRTIQTLDGPSGPFRPGAYKVDRKTSELFYFYTVLFRKPKNRPLLRCIHHLNLDLINNMDHMHISNTEPSLVSIVSLSDRRVIAHWNTSNHSICISGHVMDYTWIIVKFQYIPYCREQHFSCENNKLIEAFKILQYILIQCTCITTNTYKIV